MSGKKWVSLSLIVALLRTTPVVSAQTHAVFEEPPTQALIAGFLPPHVSLTAHTEWLSYTGMMGSQSLDEGLLAGIPIKSPVVTAIEQFAHRIQATVGVAWMPLLPMVGYQALREGVPPEPPPSRWAIKIAMIKSFGLEGPTAFEQGTTDGQAGLESNAKGTPTLPSEQEKEIAELKYHIEYLLLAMSEEVTKLDERDKQLLQLRHQMQLKQRELEYHQVKKQATPAVRPLMSPQEANTYATEYLLQQYLEQNQQLTQKIERLAQTHPVKPSKQSLPAVRPLMSPQEANTYATEYLLNQHAENNQRLTTQLAQLSQTLDAETQQSTKQQQQIAALKQTIAKTQRTLNMLEAENTLLAAYLKEKKPTGVAVTHPVSPSVLPVPTTTPPTYLTQTLLPQNPSVIQSALPMNKENDKRYIIFNFIDNRNYQEGSEPSPLPNLATPAPVSSPVAQTTPTEKVLPLKPELQSFLYELLYLPFIPLPLNRHTVGLQAVSGRVYKFSNKAQVWQFSGRGEVATQEDMISTKEASSVILELPEEAGYARLFPQTDIQLKEISILPGVDGDQLVKMKQERGNMLVKIRQFNRRKSLFEVQTPGGDIFVAGVKLFPPFKKRPVEQRPVPPPPAAFGPQIARGSNCHRQQRSKNHHPIGWDNSHSAPFERCIGSFIPALGHSRD